MSESKSAAPIIVFSSNSAELLKKTVLDGLDYLVYDPPNINSFRVLSLTRALCQVCIRDFSLVVRSLISIRALRQVKRWYRAILIAEDIKRMQPKVVITYIDNSSEFHKVSALCPITPFLAVQNGGRGAVCATAGWGRGLFQPIEHYNIDEYFCFGPAVKELFDRFDHEIKKYIFCGSLMSGYFHTSCLRKGEPPEIQYDICLVSQWHIGERETQPVEYNDAVEMTAQFVSRYATARHVRVCVALRPDIPEQEGTQQAYYRQYFKGGCHLVENDGAFSSYRAMWSSNLVITVNSTLGVESFGAGKKVLFMNPHRSEFLQPVAEGVWTFREKSYDVFEDRVDTLLAMSNEAFSRIARREMRNVYTFDPERPAHKVIRERLLELVSEPK